METITTMKDGRAALLRKAEQDFDDAMIRAELFQAEDKFEFAKLMLAKAKEARSRITKYGGAKANNKPSRGGDTKPPTEGDIVTYLDAHCVTWGLNEPEPEKDA